MASRKVQFRAAEEDAGKRLDQVLAARIPELSRRKARVLLDIGGVFVDRARVKVASRTVRAGQLIEAHLGGALERATKSVGGAARAEDARVLPAYSVVFEDDDIVVIDKPAGLLTAPTPESDRNNLADLLRRDRSRPEIFLVHRIDLGTSGLLVFAKSALANQQLAALFREHDVVREYIAVVQGAMEKGGGADITVRVPVKGRPALTHLAVVERLGDAATVLSARLETGRTHQIRIHCSHLGHPVFGDLQYGRRTAHDPPRMALHAASLGFAHPRTGEELCFSSPMSEDLSAWLTIWRPRWTSGPGDNHASNHD
jgi:23S rRNA pseudouridine1911/1915/1917 synthase